MDGYGSSWATDQAARWLYRGLLLVGVAGALIGGAVWALWTI